MIILISPAKTMKEGSAPCMEFPSFLSKTQKIVDVVQNMSKEQMKEMWGCSDKIVTLYQERFAKMHLKKECMPAIERYTGLQYRNLSYLTLTSEQKQYIQKHVRILSAFYGVERPEDGIVSYRMDMASKIAIDGSKNLYDYWGEQICRSFKDDFIVNLASEEYADMVRPFIIKEDTFVTVSFKKVKNGKLRSESTLAKRARGSFLRFMAQNNVQSVEEMKRFQEMDFEYAEDISDNCSIVFIQREKD